MARVSIILRDMAQLFRLDTDDREVARAQFQSFAKQIPLLYLIMIGNAAAIATSFLRADLPVRTVAVPIALCVSALGRAIWWLRQDTHEEISDLEIARRLRRTCHLAIGLTIGVEFWGMSMYDLGDAGARSHLVFFLALTEVSTIFCLMSIRAAAMRVAAVTMLFSIFYFSWVDQGRMLTESIVICFVGAGLMVITFRYNVEFIQMIHSRRNLKLRQIELENLSLETSRIAMTDALSGLPNRRHLLARLEELDSAAHPPLDHLAIMFIDLDGFKEINDAHGHHAGDQLINSLSARLRDACPSQALLARVGGDEFAVLIEAPDATARALALANRYREEIRIPVLVDRQVMQVGSSIGIASNASAQFKAEELLRRADTAMYHVKVHSKGEVVVFDESFDEGRLHRLAVQGQIGSGLAKSEFSVLYQPIVAANGGAVVAAEALIRWPGRSEVRSIPKASSGSPRPPVRSGPSACSCSNRPAGISSRSATSS